MEDPLDGQGFVHLALYARHYWAIHAKASAGTSNPRRLMTLLDQFLGQPTDSSPAYRCWHRMIAEEDEVEKLEYLATSQFITLNISPEDFGVNKIASFAYCVCDLVVLLPDCMCRCRGIFLYLMAWPTQFTLHTISQYPLTKLKRPLADSTSIRA